MTVSTKLRRIAELAKGAPDMAFTSLAYHIDIEFLREAFKRTRKSGAAGIDGQTAAEYEANLEENLQDLLNRLKSGKYYAPPVRRVNIPKGDGRKTRPIGIPTFEDKVLQRAVTMILNEVYEQDFLDCSYGFRPKRSAHQALKATWDTLTEMKGGWVLEVDIQGFFDNLDHAHLRSFLDQRVRDGVLRRVIGKWLNAGVFEAGRTFRPVAGTPQGGVISPLLANVYLHVVLDTWFADMVKPTLQGQAKLIRYADDFIIVFSRESDAKRVMSVLPKRLGKFGLKVHPEKTKLIQFRRPPYGWKNAKSPRRDGYTGPGVFDLLGFTHHWTRSRKGNWVVRQRTAKGRLSRAVTAVNRWCRANRHLKVAKQHQQLSRKLRGHYAYYGLSGNAQQLSTFRESVRKAWRKWLGRRSQKGQMWWHKYEKLLKRYPLPGIRVVHSVFK